MCYYIYTGGILHLVGFKVILILPENILLNILVGNALA